MRPTRTPIFSVICFLVALLVLPGGAADFAGGTGEPADPYLIATAGQLISIGNDPNLLDKHFRLLNDIDLDPNLPEGKVFTDAPIASRADVYALARPKFTGRLFAEGHAIRNLTIVSAGGQYLGLFGTIGSEGRVYDLNLEAVTIEGAARLGALAAVNEGSIVNCTATGSVTGGDDSRWLGGLVGINLRGMTDCYADVAILAGRHGAMLGGLAGLHQGRILNGRAAGSVTGGDDALCVGGLVGMSLGGAIERSNAQGPVYGHDGAWALGGLVGRQDSDSLILYCYATGHVTTGRAGHDVGGLVGQNWYGSLRYCFATAAVKGKERSHTLGGLVGSCLGGRIVACHADGPVSGRKGSRFLGGLVGQVQTASVVANCYATARVLVDGNLHGRGGLVGRVASPHDARVVQCFWDTEVSGASTSAAGTGLTTAKMQDRRTFRSAGWDLMGDRTDGTADVWRMSKEWGYPFLSAFSYPNDLHVLEGAGKSFDPYLIATAEDLGTMIRHDRLAWYKLVADIDLAGITWSTAPIPVFYGFFDGHGHRISNLTIRSAAPSPVGLFGSIERGAWVYDLGLEEVSIDAYYGSSEVGGLAGTNAGNIAACFVTGQISAGGDCRSLGGLVGANRQGAIGDCYAIATVTAREGSNQLGGLVGYNFLGPLVNCYAAGAVVAPHTTEHLGYLVGYTAKGTSTTNCYYLTDFAHGGRDFGAGTPLIDAQMKQQASFLDWDFAKIWRLCEGQTYPHLRWERIICDP